MFYIYSPRHQRHHHDLGRLSSTRFLASSCPSASLVFVIFLKISLRFSGSRIINHKHTREVLSGNSSQHIPDPLEPAPRCNWSRSSSPLSCQSSPASPPQPVLSSPAPTAEDTNPPQTLSAPGSGPVTQPPSRDPRSKSSTFRKLLHQPAESGLDIGQKYGWKCVKN